MGRIDLSYETLYDRGDVVIFEHAGHIEAGIIESYYTDRETIWYDIRVNLDTVYSYSVEGDIAEYEIIGKLDDKLSSEAKKIILNKE